MKQWRKSETVDHQGPMTSLHWLVAPQQESDAMKESQSERVQVVERA